MPHQTLIALLDLGIAGTYVLSAAILVALVLLGIAFLGTDAPRFRCRGSSSTTRPSTTTTCDCGPGRHHPSCALRRADR